MFSAIFSVTPAVPGVPLYYADAPESARTYSSVWVNDKIGTGHARSTLDSVQAWSAGSKRAGDWLQIDLGQVLTVGGTVVQSRAVTCTDQYVKTYTVSTSLDGRGWATVAGLYNGKLVCPLSHLLFKHRPI